MDSCSPIRDCGICPVGCLVAWLLSCGFFFDPAVASNVSVRQRPNILLIISEDNGPELGCYGDPYAQTPNLDHLAASGVRFETVYVTQPVCSPSRSSILTGLYPHQNGQIGLATHQFRMFTSWPTTYSILKKAGYRTGMIGKLHIHPESAVEKSIDCRAIRSANFAKKDLADYSSTAAEFFGKTDQPFFLTVNYPDAHWPVQNRVQHRPAKPIGPGDVRPMSYIGFDNDRLRRHVQGYYNCLSRLDECVGELLAALETSGKSENTMVIYLGDHGAQFARGKVFLSEGGLRIPMLIRWPGKTLAGHVSRELVSTIDLLPTIARAADAPLPDNLPGIDLAAAIQGKPGSRLREYLFAERNSDSADLHFPQRAVRDDRFKLIRTLMPGSQDPGADKCLRNGASNFRGSPTYGELESASRQTRTAYETWLRPPEYQLYDLKADPDEWANLADDPNYTGIKQRLLNALTIWQVESDDKLRSPNLLEKLNQEMAACRTANVRSPKGGWRYVDYLAPESTKKSLGQERPIGILRTE